MLARHIQSTHTRPRLRLLPRAMNEDTDRSTPTDLAPPPADEERKTNPPDPIEATKADAFVTEALRSPGLSAETIRELAEHELVSLYRTAIGMHNSLLGASGLLEQNRRNTVEDIARVVDRGFDRVWERVEPRLTSQDRKIEGLKTELSGVRDQLKGALERIDELERQLDANEAQPAPATPT